MNDLEHPVYWQGRQWAVTGFGIETVDEPYHYFWEKERLGSLQNDGLCFQFPMHILEKTWLDVQDMLAAWDQVMIYHAKHFTVIPPGWKDELDRAVRARSQWAIPR